MRIAYFLAPWARDRVDGLLVKSLCCFSWQGSCSISSTCKTARSSLHYAAIYACVCMHSFLLMTDGDVLPALLACHSDWA